MIFKTRFKKQFIQRVFQLEFRISEILFVLVILYDSLVGEDRLLGDRPSFPSGQLLVDPDRLVAAGGLVDADRVPRKVAAADEADRPWYRRP